MGLLAEALLERWPNQVELQRAKEDCHAEGKGRRARLSDGHRSQDSASRKVTGRERASKHRERVANSTYNHNRIVLALKRQINTLKQENTRLNRENKALKAVDDEKSAYLTSLEDFVESNPNVASVRRQYG